MKEYAYQKPYNLIQAMKPLSKLWLAVGLIWIVGACGQRQAEDELLPAIQLAIENVRHDLSQINLLSAEAVLERSQQLGQLMQHPSFRTNMAVQEELNNALNFLVAIEDHIPRLEASCQYSLNQLESLKDEIINQSLTQELAKQYLTDEIHIADDIHAELDYFINRWNAHKYLIETLQQEL